MYSTCTFKKLILPFSIFLHLSRRLDATTPPQTFAYPEEKGEDRRRERDKRAGQRLSVRVPSS